MLKAEKRKKIKRPSEPRIQPTDYVTASEKWKLMWLGRAKFLMKNPSLKGISDLVESELDNDSVRSLLLLTSNHTKTSVNYMMLLQRVLAPGDNLISGREKFLIAIKTSWFCRSEYLFVSNVCWGLQNGITFEEVENIINGSPSLPWKSNEIVLFQVVEELCNDFCLSDETWEQVIREYNEEQLTGLIILVGFGYRLSVFSKCIGLQVDEVNNGFDQLSAKINQIKQSKQIFDCYKKIKKIFREKNEKNKNIIQLSVPRIEPKDYSLWNEECKNVFNYLIKTTYNVSSLSDLINMNLSELATPLLTQLYKLTSNLQKTANNYGALIQRSLPPPLDNKTKALLLSREKEIIIIRSGWLCRAEYEFAAHTAIGLDIGLSWEEIEGIVEGPDSSNWKSKDALLLRAVDELHENLFISDATWNNLSNNYEEQQLMSIIVVAGQYHSVAMFNNSLGIQNSVNNSGFGKLSEKLNQNDWIKKWYHDIKSGIKLYRSKIKNE